MSNNRWVEPIIWGSALFSMFFGAGNVIYSLWVGYLANASNLPWALSGFMLTGVGIPFLCLIAMTCFEGDLDRYFSIIPIRSIRLILISILLFVWAPLGSIPRAIEMTYSSLQVIWSGTPWGWTHLLVAAVIFAAASTPPFLVKLLGKWLTPLLVALIIYLSAIAHLKWPTPELSDFTAAEMFGESALLGYQTMDGIAALFFARFFMQLLKSRSDSTQEEGSSDEPPARHKWWTLITTFGFAIALQAGVYALLISASSRMSDHLQVANPAQLLSVMALKVLGPLGAAVTSAIVIVACIPTAITLVMITENYYRRVFFPNISSTLVRCVVVLFAGVVSLLQLEGIRRLTQPVLEWAYPLIVIVSCVTLASVAFATLFASKSLLEKITSSGSDESRHEV